MQTVQLALGSEPFVPLLQDLLAHSDACQITAVAKPDPKKPGVLVVNDEALDRLARPLEHPERIVLITQNDAQRLARAWEAGIRCVLFDSDPPRTIMLAVLAAALRVRSPNEAIPLAHIPHVVPNSCRKR